MRLRLVCWIVLSLSACAQGQVLFADDFSGNSLEDSKWYTGSWWMGRSYLGDAVTVANGMATLHMDTYNPTTPGTFLGSQIGTLQTFPMGNGLEMSARVRVNPLPDGIVTSFFADNYQPLDNNEIDFESLSSQNNALGGKASSLALTSFHDWGTPGSVQLDNIHNTHNDVTVGGLVPGQFNTLTIRWLPGQTQWLVNGNLLWQTSAAQARGPLSVQLNFWAAADSWPRAFAAGLVPALTPEMNQSFTYDVDWVSVRALPPPIPGDINRDGVVNIFDLLDLAQRYGYSGTTWATGDLNGDGVTDIKDLIILAANYGGTLPSASQLAGLSPAVRSDAIRAFGDLPEPGGLATLSMIAACLVRRRRVVNVSAAPEPTHSVVHSGCLEPEPQHACH